MRKTVSALVVMVMVLALSLPVAASLRWCKDGTPPGLEAKDDTTFPAFQRVEEKAGFNLHDVNPLLGNTAKNGRSAEDSPVYSKKLPADAVGQD